ncbi:hypothetical protein CERSUDRAFT_81624 [Gelatoporia subvermispora B]|uniref:NADP-dependent oxidoreductase domain-containing protein n=1 Tax=Ceriporiopsis subvermispora (strain B) TaxID=914234 RepID=M2PQI0_CERS8|nr:hypothetical protein CERSUDRAFT_81624 [Gelatoporia subvermispora B]
MAAFFPTLPDPPTKLGRHRQLSKLTGLHVSPICLGGASLGEAAATLGFGATDREQSFALLDAYYDGGGNFIDTANSYRDESSEQYIGEWMEQRGNRDQMVIATKYATCFKSKDPSIKQKTHYTGNTLKALHISVEASLKKLRTSYIDILYVHWYDWDTPIEEIMNGLHNLVVAGKVLYLGISDTPAWVVSEANMYARCTGKTPFVVYQGAWSILQRDFEQEIIPMARKLGLALAPWNVLAGGKIRTDAEEERRRLTGEKGRVQWSSSWERTEDEKKVCRALEEVASQVDAKSITAVAIAYVMQKTPYVFPIIGGRKVEQLMDNLEALDISLSGEQIQYLEGILPFSPAFPNSLIGDGSKPSWLLTSAGHLDGWPVQQPIRPVQK